MPGAQSGEGAALFTNAEWLVTADGLEHRRSGYFIARDAVAQRRSDGSWAWPVHMAEKLWCAPGAFAEAFMHAVRAYDLQADAGLALAFQDAGRLQAEQAALVQEDMPRREAGVALRMPVRPRPEKAREARAHPWRPGRVAQAGLTLLQWLRLGVNIK